MTSSTMNDRDNRIAIVTMLVIMSGIVAVAFGGLGALIGYERGMKSCRQHHASDTVVFRDTVVINRLHIDTVTRIENVQVPVPYEIRLHDTVIDSVNVLLPMEHRRASVKDTCDIWYHGISAGIDSVNFFFNNEIVTQTVTEYAERPCRANSVAIYAGIDEVSLLYTRDVGRMYFGASAGYGFDRSPKARCMVGYRF